MIKKVITLFFCLLEIIAIRAYSEEAIRIGSKTDTEGKLLGNIILETLRANGLKTKNDLSTGNTDTTRAALASGNIDIYPDYTGDGSVFFADTKNPIWKNSTSGYQRIKDLDFNTHQFVWLKPAPANNEWTIAIPRKLSLEQHIYSMSDWARYVQHRGAVKLIVSSEFVSRHDGLQAMEENYKFTLHQNQLLTVVGSDTSVMLKSVAMGQSSINASMACETDGSLNALGLVALRNDRPNIIYSPSPVIRESVIKLHPQIASLLEHAFKYLDTPTLRTLNEEITVWGQSPHTVALSFLKEHQIIH